MQREDSLGGNILPELPSHEALHHFQILDKGGQVKNKQKFFNNLNLIKESQASQYCG